MYIDMKKIKKLSENGFAPIIVSIIIVIVLSLLTIGFVTLANNNTKSALNRQLSNDAYYAAETGVNDAVAAITHGYTSNKTACGLDGVDKSVNGYTYLENNLVGGPQDYYSCLLINPTPATLQYSSVTPNQPTVALLSTVNSSGNAEVPTDIVFSWQPSAQVETAPYQFAPSSYFPNCNYLGVSGACLPPATNWQIGNEPITGILRVALTPIANGSMPTDTSTTYTAFLYPLNGSGTINFAPAYSPSTVGANSGLEVSGNCSATYTGLNRGPEDCSVEIPLGGYSAYIMSVRSLYTNSQVTVEALKNNSNLFFRNAQILIDSTGSDHGIQRRIQVRVSSLNYNGFPAFDIASSNSICKDLQVYPNNASTGNPGNALTSCGL